MNDILEIDPTFLTACVATIVCIVLDVVMHAIQDWQKRRAGYGETSSFGFGGRLGLSIVVNIALCAGFAYTYAALGLASGNSFLVAAVIWLIIAIPLLATSRFTDEFRQQMIAIRILIWLLKMAAIALFISLFME